MSLQIRKIVGMEEVDFELLRRRVSIVFVGRSHVAVSQSGTCTGSCVASKEPPSPSLYSDYSLGLKAKEDSKSIFYSNV